MGNLSKDKLKGDKLGVYFGTFAGLTISGHTEIINQAKRENDGVVVIVSGYKGDRGDTYVNKDSMNLPLERRFRYIREEYSDTDMVYVNKLSEDSIPKMPDGWSEWMDLFIEKIKESIEKNIEDVELTFYMGEREYAEELDKRLRGYLKESSYRIHLFDRKPDSISASKVRKQPIKYFTELAKPFRRILSYNIAFVGTASGGKTELTKDIGRRLNAPVQPETSREYQEKYNVRDDEFRVGDWDELIVQTFSNSDALISSDANMGITVHDTGNIVNLMYVIQAYKEGNLTTQEYEYLVQLAEFRIRKANWSLIFVVPPVTEYVDDGFRNPNQSSDEIRWEMHEELMRLLNKYGHSDKVRLLDAKGTKYDTKGFYARYEQALNYIVEDIKEKQNYNILTKEDVNK